MENDLSKALEKLAEVHDRRLGELAAQIGRLADVLGNTPTAGDRELWPLERIASALETNDVAEALREARGDQRTST